MTGKPQNRTPNARTHTLALENRESLLLEGIEEVVNFDENTVTLNTLLGAMSIEGKGLHILTLSLESGHVEIEGMVDAIFYEDRNEKVKRGFFSRLVR